MERTEIVFSGMKRFSQLVTMAVLLLIGNGCAVMADKVDPYSTLLPAGTKIADSNTAFSAASLKNETAYLVVGTNFVNYADAWNKYHKSAEQGGNLAYGRQMMLDMLAQWSPARTTSIVAADLQKHFKNVVVVNDLAEAQDKKAKWIVMFDHAIQGTSASASWTNTTSVDLLDGKFRRAVAASFSEHKDYGLAWSNSDVERFMRYRGNDVLHSVNSALAQFDTKLAAAR